MKIKRYSLLCSSILLTACVSSAMLEKASNTKLEAYTAQQSGDWQSSRDLFSQALSQARLSGASEELRGEITYQYARSLAVTCQFDEAISRFSDALELYKEANIPHYIVMYELASVYEHQKKYAAAMPYYAELFSTIQRQNIRDISRMRLADAYEKYAQILINFNRIVEGRTFNENAALIRKHSPDASLPDELTPYGKHCS